MGKQITPDGDCNEEIKRCLLLGIKVMTNLDSILKSRDTNLPTKIHIVKAVIFPKSCINVRVGPKGRVRVKELTLLKYSI